MDLGFAIINGQSHHICLHRRVGECHRGHLAASWRSGARLTSGQRSERHSNARVRTEGIYETAAVLG